MIKISLEDGNTIKIIRLFKSEEIQSLDHSLFSFDSAKELGAVFVTMRESHPKHYWPTFYGVAHNYGLQLLPSGHFYYSNSKPDIGDVIIHTLAIQKDTRGIIYASVIALKSKYDVRKLLKKRQTYNLSRDYIHRFVEFILSDGKKPFGGLDSYHELRSVGYGAV